jgi:hypothetical protein
MDKRVRRSLTVIVALVAAGVVAGVALATIPDGTGTIHACYGVSDKSLRVVDTGGCAKGEAPVSWNQNAIEGSPGQQGNQGLQGDTGPEGPAGLTFASTQSADVSADSVIGGFFKELTCPTGQTALEGGWFWLVLYGPTKMDQPDVESFPIGDDSWGFAVGANSSYAGEPMAVTLTCVNAN